MKIKGMYAHVQGATGNARKAGWPREPLYTFAEIADRLGTTPGRLMSLCSHHGVIPQPEGTDLNVNNGPKRRYRFSDAKAWLKKLPEGVTL